MVPHWSTRRCMFVLVDSSCSDSWVAHLRRDVGIFARAGCKWRRFRRQPLHRGGWQQQVRAAPPLDRLAELFRCWLGWAGLYRAADLSPRIKQTMYRWQH